MRHIIEARFAPANRLLRREETLGELYWSCRPSRQKNQGIKKAVRFLRPQWSYDMSADDPITLAEACKLFPKAHLTVSALRAEYDRGRLDIFRLGRRDCTTEADMRAMVKASKENSRCRVSNPTTANADDGDQARSAAALTQITSALKRT